MSYTHPVCGYLFPVDDDEDIDLTDLARQLADLEADPLRDLQEWEQAFHYYLDMDDWDLIKTYRDRAGY